MDRDVVERARSGDQDAFAELVHQISDTLLGVARRILRDPTLAEDVLQNTLLTIWRKLPHLRDADRFRGMGLPDPRPRLLRGGTAEPTLGIDDPCASYATSRPTPTTSSGSRTVTIWNRPFASSRSTSARSSSSITTSACPSWRWPRRSASRTGRRDHVCTMRPGRFALRSSRARGRRISRKDERHERHAELRASRQQLVG